MTDRGHLEKKYLVGLIFLLRFFYCGSLSKFEFVSSNGELIWKYVAGMLLMFLCRKQSHLVINEMYTVKPVHTGMPWGQSFIPI